MVCVFALSIAPTILLHNTFARHTDSVQKHTGGSGQQIASQLFHCQCDHFVAESPFTDTAIFGSISSPQIFLVPGQQQQVDGISCQTIIHSLRGPPLV